MCNSMRIPNKLDTTYRDLYCEKSQNYIAISCI